MKIKNLFTIVLLSMCLASTSFAGQNGNNGTFCKAQDIVGSYVAVIQRTHTGAGGELIDRTQIFQLNLSAGGTAHMFYTGLIDFPFTYGTRSPYIGSWSCRADGKLVMTTITARYFPTSFDPFSGQPVTDVEIHSHWRHNRVFTVEDKDTITLRQSILRQYSMSEDPSDAGGGSVPFGELTSDLEFNRVVPSDAGLTP